jgi:hypothetical protein
VTKNSSAPEPGLERARITFPKGMGPSKLSNFLMVLRAVEWVDSDYLLNSRARLS